MIDRTKNIINSIKDNTGLGNIEFIDCVSDFKHYPRPLKALTILDN